MQERIRTRAGVSPSMMPVGEVERACVGVLGRCVLVAQEVGCFCSSLDCFMGLDRLSCCFSRRDSSMAALCWMLSSWDLNSKIVLGGHLR